MEKKKSEIDFEKANWKIERGTFDLSNVHSILDFGLLSSSFFLLFENHVHEGPGSRWEGKKAMTLKKI